MKLLLFDIDGTLILSGGAGLRAMDRAFYQLYGIKDAFRRVQLAGRTDTSIIRDALEENGIGFTQKAVDDFRELYYQLLQEEIAVPNKNKYLMPGVEPLLTELADRKDIYLGLLTGNWEKSGRTKLGHFGINDFFPLGAFADDSEIRNELLPFAVERFRKRYDKVPEPDRIYVIGDTPSDIHCAKPHGAVSVAVGAAKYSVEELQQHEPDYLFEDLSDTLKVLEVIG